MSQSILPRQFLFVGIDADSRDLLVVSLRQHFKHMTVLDSKETSDALEIVACQTIDAVILERTDEDGAVELVQWFHALDPTLPLIVMAWSTRSAPPVLKAGAKAFLSYDQWSTLGPLVLQSVLSRLPKPEKISPRLEVVAENTEGDRAESSTNDSQSRRETYSERAEESLGSVPQPNEKTS